MGAELRQSVDFSKVVRLDRLAETARRKRRKAPFVKLETCEVAALRALGRYVILTPDLFGLAAGYEDSQSRKGLRLLFEKGLADRGFFLTERTEEQVAKSLPTVPQGLAYKLTTDGLKRGIAEGVIDRASPTIRKRWRGAAPVDMKHRLLIVEMMIRTRLDVARQERLAIGRSIFDFIRQDGGKATKDQISEGRFLVPDLIFELEEFFGDKSTMLFCEIENTKLQPVSTDKDQDTVTGKISPYGQYFRNAKRKHRGATQDLLLYIQNQSPEHLDEVITHILWDNVGDVRNVVRFTTIDEIREHGVLKGRWRNWRGDFASLVR